MYILKSKSFLILVLLFCIIFNGCCTYLGYTIGYRKDVHTGGEIKEYTDIRDVEYNIPVTVFSDDDTVAGIYEGVTFNSLKLRRIDWRDSTQNIFRDNINKIQIITPSVKTYRTLGTIIGLTCDVILFVFISDQLTYSNKMSLN